MISKHNLTKALAGLYRSKGFTFTIVTTLGISTAALLVVIAIASAIFFTPLSFDNEDQIYLVNQNTTLDTYAVKGQQNQNTLNYWLRNQSSFEYFSPVFTHEVYLEDTRQQPLLMANFVSSDYFQILDVPILKGASFTEMDDDLDSVSSNILISESTWHEYFEGRDSITEEIVTILGVPRRVIGIVADSFTPPNVFGGNNVSIWLPWADQNENAWSTLEETNRAIGQLRAKLTAAQAEEILDSLMTEVESEWKAEWPQVRSISADLIPIREVELGNMKVLSSFLLIGALGLLAIASANVSNLFFSRTMEKNRITALQIIIGAKRKDLLAEKLSESSLICLISVLFGVFVSWIILSLLPVLMPENIPMLQEFSIDVVVLLSAFVITTALALIFAATSLTTIDFADLKSHVQGSGKGVTKSISGKKMSWFIAAQLAVATAVLLGGSFFLAKALEMKTSDLGLDPQGLYHFHAFAGTGQVDSGRQEFLEGEIRNALLKKEEIEAVSIALVSPLRNVRYTREITDMDAQSIGNFQANFIDDHYFPALGIRIVEGRNFNNLSFESGQNEVIVSEAVAEKLEPNALGQSIKANGGTEYTVVGIVEDGFHPSHYHQDKGARIYFTKMNLGFPIALKSAMPLEQIELSQWLKEIDNELFIFEFDDVNQTLDRMLFLDGLLIVLISSLMLITLLLSVVGIVGILTYTMKIRQHDIGIRIAVGAKRKHIYLSIVKQVAMPIAGGLIIGLLVVAYIFSVLPEIYQKHISISPVLVTGLLLVIIASCLAATLWPVQNLLKSNPQNTLKGD